MDIAAATKGHNGFRGPRGAPGTKEFAAVITVSIPEEPGVADPVLQLDLDGSEAVVHESETDEENPPIALIGIV